MSESLTSLNSPSFVAEVCLFLLVGQKFSGMLFLCAFRCLLMVLFRLNADLDCPDGMGLFWRSSRRQRESTRLSKKSGQNSRGEPEQPCPNISCCLCVKQGVRLSIVKTGTVLYCTVAGCYDGFVF